MKLQNVLNIKIQEIIKYSKSQNTVNHKIHVIIKYGN